MGSAVVWFEVAGTDLESLTSFYSELFDWKIEADDNGYGMVDTRADGGIPGGVFAPGPDTGTWTTFYVDVPDVDAALAAATQLGGAVLQPATPIPGGAVVGQISDPQGQRIGLFQQPPS
jgi:predicted enzyme related to lactoylglutathione lyase